MLTSCDPHVVTKLQSWGWAKFLHSRQVIDDVPINNNIVLYTVKPVLRGHL